MKVSLRIYAVIIGLLTLILASAVVNAQVLVPPPPQGPWLSEGVTTQSPSYLVLLLAGCNPQQPYNLYVFTPSQYSAWASGETAEVVFAGEFINGGAQQWFT